MVYVSAFNPNQRVSSFSNNPPLYVPDGFPFEGSINDIVFINDIESITILKDASSRAFTAAGHPVTPLS